MQITPLFDRILIRPVDEAQETKTGLLIPDIAAKNRLFTYGEVVGTGPGRHNADGTLIKPKVKVGQVVMYPRKAGFVIPMPCDDGPEIEMVIMREPDILAIVTDLPKATTLVDANSRRILSMVPGSRAIADASVENIEKVEIARREGWIEPDPRTGRDGYEDDEREHEPTA
jgi:chaperonin GroES